MSTADQTDVTETVDPTQFEREPSIPLKPFLQQRTVAALIGAVVLALTCAAVIANRPVGSSTPQAGNQVKRFTVHGQIVFSGPEYTPPYSGALDGYTTDGRTCLGNGPDGMRVTPDQPISIHVAQAYENSGDYEGSIETGVPKGGKCLIRFEIPNVPSGVPGDGYWLKIVDQPYQYYTESGVRRGPVLS